MAKIEELIASFEELKIPTAVISGEPSITIVSDRIHTALTPYLDSVER